MTERPRVLIEDWLPMAELGIESRREAAPIPGQFPKLKTLHVWWARRPLVASAGAVLGSVMPTWTSALADAFADVPELATAKDYQTWFLRLCGILGDPVAAQSRIAEATEQNIRLGAAAYGYKPAFKNSPTSVDRSLLHKLLTATWGEVPSVLDPTAGGGSIPFEAARYGLAVTANDLNPVAVAILMAGVEIPVRYGIDLLPDLREWGNTLVRRITDRLVPYFALPDASDNNTYLFSRTIMCPRTGKAVPLAPNWWLSRVATPVAVRLITERGGHELDECEFEIASGREIDFDPAVGTMRGGNAISPWDGLAIDGEYIKDEALADRMGSVLFAVAYRTGDGKKGYRAPCDVDLTSLANAQAELSRVRPAWEQSGVLPTEEVPAGNDPKLQLWRRRWTDMFTERQLLVHGTFVEEYRRLLSEVPAVLKVERAEAVLTLLGVMQGKALDYNSRQCTWDVTRDRVSTGGEHAFPFRSTHPEFEGARELYPWCLEQLLDAYASIAGLLWPGSGSLLDTSSPAPGSVTITEGSAGHLETVDDRSQTLVCIDPPYYDNVWYAELSDFFYVWEKRTIGSLFPGHFATALTDKSNEAVVSEIRFKDAGRRKALLAKADYQAKMTGIFAECMRVLRDDGVLTVMFTHKKAEAWDTLGMSLMEAGFTIETSWPVQTESDQSRHQMKKNSAKTTIMLVCRKRPTTDANHPFFEDIEGAVRSAARTALRVFSEMGLSGVDLLLSTYGPSLSVISSQWPVYSSEPDSVTGKSRLLRPEEALDAAREEVVRLQRQRLVGRQAQLDPLTDFVLIAWDTFRAVEFPFDEARRLALAVGGLDVDELVRARILEKKSGTVVLLPPAKRVRRNAEAEATLPGLHVDATGFPVVLDAVHTMMYLADVDGLVAAKVFIDRHGLTVDDRFLAALQGLVNAIPRTKLKGEWIREEARSLDSLCAAYFPDIILPLEPMLPEAPELFPDA